MREMWVLLFFLFLGEMVSQTLLVEVRGGSFSVQVLLTRIHVRDSPPWLSVPLRGGEGVPVHLINNRCRCRQEVRGQQCYGNDSVQSARTRVCVCVMAEWDGSGVRVKRSPWLIETKRALPSTLSLIDTQPFARVERRTKGWGWGCCGHALICIPVSA